MHKLANYIKVDIKSLLCYSNFRMDNYYSETLIDIILWGEDEPRVLLSKIYCPNSYKYMLFGKFLIWERKIDAKN